MIPLSLLLACGEPARVVVLYSGEQPRSAPVIDCDGCVPFDLDGDGRPPSAPWVMLDGHSLPGVTLIGQPEPRVADAVAATGATTAVLATCYGAEIDLLATLFAAAPALDRVIAHPGAQPWDAFGVDPDCLRDGGDDTCVDLPPGFSVWTRAELPAMRDASASARDDLARCAGPKAFARFFPALLCVGDGERAWVARVPEVPPGCLKGLPTDHRQVDCAGFTGGAR